MYCQSPSTIDDVIVTTTRCPTADVGVVDLVEVVVAANSVDVVVDTRVRRRRRSVVVVTYPQSHVPMPWPVTPPLRPNVVVRTVSSPSPPQDSVNCSNVVVVVVDRAVH